MVKSYDAFNIALNAYHGGISSSRLLRETKILVSKKKRLGGKLQHHHIMLSSTDGTTFPEVAGAVLSPLSLDSADQRISWNTGAEGIYSFASGTGGLGPGPRSYGLRSMNYVMKTGVRRCSAVQVLARQGGTRTLRGQAAPADLRRLWDDTVSHVVKFSRHRGVALSTRKFRAKKKSGLDWSGLDGDGTVAPKSSVPTQSGSESGVCEFEVDMVLGRRLAINKDPVLEYLVSWKGFGTSYNSWEPEANLGQARSKIEEFLQLLGVSDAKSPALNFTRCASCFAQLHKSSIRYHIQQHTSAISDVRVCPLCFRSSPALIPPSVDLYRMRGARRQRGLKRSYNDSMRIIHSFAGEPLIGRTVVMREGQLRGKTGVIRSFDKEARKYSVAIDHDDGVIVQEVLFNQLVFAGLEDCRERRVSLLLQEERSCLGFIWTSDCSRTDPPSKRPKMDWRYGYQNVSSIQSVAHCISSRSMSLSAPGMNIPQIPISSVLSHYSRSHLLFGVPVRIQRHFVALKDLLESLNFKCGSFSTVARPFLLYLKKLEPHRLLSICVNRLSGFGRTDDKITALSSLGVGLFCRFFAAVLSQTEDESNSQRTVDQAPDCVPLISTHGQVDCRKRLLEFVDIRSRELLCALGDSSEEVRKDVDAYIDMYRQQRIDLDASYSSHHEVKSSSNNNLPSSDASVRQDSTTHLEHRNLMEHGHLLAKRKLEKQHHEQSLRLYRLQHQLLQTQSGSNTTSTIENKPKQQSSVISDIASPPRCPDYSHSSLPLCGWPGE
eukprot:83915_1